MVSIVSVMAIHTRSSGALTKGAGMFQSLVEAGSYAWADAQLRVLFILIALHCAMTMSFETVLPVLSQEVLNNPENANTLMMAVGAGALVGVFAISGTRKANSRGMITARNRSAERRFDDDPGDGARSANRNAGSRCDGRDTGRVHGHRRRNGAVARP